MKGKKVTKSGLSVLVMCTLVTTGIAGIIAAEEPKQLHTIDGYCYYMNTSMIAPNVTVEFTNLNLSETVSTKTGQVGYYSIAVGPWGEPGTDDWTTGHLIEITAYGNTTDGYNGWIGKAKAILDDYIYRNIILKPPGWGALNESFEGDFPPAGWTTGIISGSYNWEQSAGESHNGSYSASYNSYWASAGSQAYLRTPRLDLTASSSDTLVFYWYHSSGDDVLTINISTDGGSTWQYIDNLTGSSGGWAKKSYDLESFPQTNNTYIEFKATSDYDYRIYIDDVQGPPIALPENDVGVVAINEPTGYLYPECNNITINVTVKNFGEYSQTNVPVKLRVTNLLNSTVVYTDTKYIDVIGKLQTEDIIFTWHPTTICNHVIEVYTALEGDENNTNNATYCLVSIYEQGGLHESFEGTFPPMYWTAINVIQNSYVAHSGVYSARFSWSSGDRWLITPRLEIESGDIFEFWMLRDYTAYSDEYFAVLYSTDMTTWTDIMNLTGSDINNLTEDTWYKWIINMSALAGQTIYIAFHYHATGGASIYIDDVKGPTIAPYHNIAVKSINAPVDGPAGWQTPNATVENLGTVTETFNVSCKIYKMTGGGYFIDEDFSAGVPPPGWSQEEAGEWDQSSTNYAGGTSPEADLDWWDISGDYAYLNSSAVDTSSASTIYLEFKSWIDHYSSSYTYNCTVYVRKDSADTWHDVTPWSNPITQDEGPDTYTIDITSYIGTGTQVRFEFDGDPYGMNDWYLDDVKIYEPPVYSLVYEDNETVTLDAGEQTDVLFDPWLATSGNYLANVTAWVTDDYNTTDNYMEKTFTIIVDTIPPEITNVQASPASQSNLPPNWVNITCDVTDNLAVDQVWVNITYPDSTTHNFTMQGGSYYYNDTYTQVGTYNFYIWAVDVEGNGNVSTGHSFVITANNAPDDPTNPNPVDGATDVSVNTMLSVDVSDPDGDAMNVYFYWGNGTLIGVDNNVPSGGTATIGPLSLDYNTTYEWYAVANDTMYEATSSTWNFTTMEVPPPPQYYYEGFETWPPDGWTIVVYSGEGTWEQEAYGVDSYEPPGTGSYYAEADSGEHSSYTFDCGLFTPRLDCTGLTNVSITYARNYQNYLGYDNAGVRIYSGGMDPANLQETVWWSSTDDPSDGVIATHYFDPSGYPDPSCVYVEFYYTTNGYTWCWKFSIDDVNISAPLYQAAHDVGVKSINYPVDGGSYPEGDITINATVKNYGTNTETFVVNCTVTKVLKNKAILFSEDMEPPVTGWTRINTSTEVADGVPSNWILPPDYDTGTYAHTGSYGAYCHYGYIPDSQDEWLIPPVIDLTTANDPYLSFWWETSYYWEATEDNFDVAVLVTTDGGSTWTEIWNTSALPSYTSWEWYDTTLGTHISLASYIGEQIQLAWRFVGGDSADFGLDDIMVYDLEMEMVYYNEQTVTNLAPGEERYVEFTPPWSATPGDYTINVTTKLAGDMNPDNDAKTADVTITGITDVGTESINYPVDGGTYSQGDIVVNATIKNYGTVPAKESSLAEIKESKLSAIQATKAKSMKANEKSFDVKLTVTLGLEGVIFYEDFESGIPGDWTIIDGYNDGATWRDDNPGGRVPPAGSNCDGTFAIADEDYEWTPMDEYLVSPVIDCTGKTGVKLAFGSYFHSYSYYDQYAEVDVYDGSTWNNVYYFTGGDDYAQTDIDISAYADNNPNVQIRFHFFATDWSYYWMVDNVMVYTGLMPGVVYEDTQTVPTLNPGETYDVEFDPWFATEGNYTIEVCTQLAGDMNASNDCKSINVTIITVAKDVGVETINYPVNGGTYQEGDIPVNATIRNYGVTDETFDVNLSVYKLYSKQQTILFEQLPHDPDDDWSIATSDAGAGYKLYENFWDASGTIYNITWWGLTLYYSAGWYQGTPDGMNFYVEIYDDDPDPANAPPTNLIASYDISVDAGDIAITYTGQYYAGFEMIKFDFQLPTPLAIDGDGWISIQSHDDTDGDWFLWHSAKTGDSFSYQEGSSPPETSDDRAIRFVGIPTQELVYSAETTMTLSAGATDYVEFIWPATPGDYIINVKTLLPGDVNPSNDQKEINVTIAPAVVNHPPNKPTNPDPADGITGVSTNPTLSVHVSDPDGDAMDVYFYGRQQGIGSFNLIGSTHASNDSDASIVWSGLNYLTTYEWYAVANDSQLENTSDIWSFTTTSPPPKPPTPPSLPEPDVLINFTGPHEWNITHWEISPETLICFDMGVAEDAGIVELYYRIDNGTWMRFRYTGCFNITLFNITLGQHYLYYFGVDKHGTCSNVACIAIEVVGNLVPTTTCIFNPPQPDGNNGWYRSQVTVTLTATDPEGDEFTIYYKVDNDEWNTYTQPFLIYDGMHTVSYYAIDEYGNHEETKTKEIKIDIYAPEISINRPSNALYIFDREILPLPGDKPIIIGKITIDATVEDTATSGIDNVFLYMDDGLKKTFDGNIEYTLDETLFGLHTMKIVAYDVAGNEAKNEMDIIIYNINLRG